MKNVITILMCAFCLSGIIAQNADGPGRAVLQTTPQIKALYSQQHDLKTGGDVAGLETIRQAIIDAWQDIDPTIAAELKTNEVTNTELSKYKIEVGGNYSNDTNKPLWGNDLVLDNGKFDGIDIDTGIDGSIYVAAYENKKRYGLGDDVVSVFKSTDNGNSFSFLTGVSGPKDYTKIKLTLMEKGPDKYMFLTTTSADGQLTNYRYDIGGGPFNFTFEAIAQDVTDFDIDVDYEFATTAQMYAVYIKTDQNIYSSRSEANSSGFGWGDEHDFGYVARECAITYGKENTFMSFVGLNSGNLYFISNSGYNDPTGWGARLDVTDGAVTESTDISLSAERKEFSDYRALLLASQRPAGSSEDYVGVANIVQGEIAFPEQIVGAGDVRAWDSWSRKEDGSTIIKTSFAKTDGDFCSIINYDDTEWEYSMWISDNPMTVQRGSSSVAEDADGNAIAVYIGENRTGLYFDSSSNTAGVSDNALSSFVYYPNPTSNTITLKSESTINNVAVYNLLGQQVLNQKLDALSSDINVGHLSTGTYVMKVTIGSETGSYKIIKN